MVLFVMKNRPDAMTRGIGGRPDAMTRGIGRENGRGLIIIYVNAGNDSSGGSMRFPMRKRGGVRRECISLCSFYKSQSIMSRGQ